MLDTYNNCIQKTLEIIKLIFGFEFTKCFFPKDEHCKVAIFLLHTF